MHRLKQIFFAFTKKERFLFLVSAFMALTSSVILAGMGIALSTTSVPASGGKYTEGFTGQPIYVNPVIASSQIDKSLVRLMFNNVGELSEKTEKSEDGRAWKVRLKENIFWHDGTPVTSDDVIFTIKKIQDAETSSPLLRVWQGIATQRLSELELRISLINPYAFFDGILGDLYILPKHIFDGVPAANWRLSEYNLRPVGSGPYRFESYEKNDDGFITSYKLLPWEKYGGEKPLIQNIAFRFFHDEKEVVENFNSGKIDAVAGISPENLAGVGRPYELFPLQLPDYYAVFLNQSKNIAVKEIAVRAALYESLDKNVLIREILGGYGRPSFGPIPYNSPLFNGELATATTSMDIASSSLEKAGWEFGDKEFREKTINKTKIPLEITLSVPRVDFLVKTAELVRLEWQKIGIKTNIVALSPEEINEAIKNRDYEALLFGNVLNRSVDLFSFWHSSERFYPGLNLALYNNEDADSLIESIRLNLNDEKRTEEIKNLQTEIAGDYPVIFLYSPDYLIIANKNLRGVATGMISEPAARFSDAKNWYIRTARVLK